VAFICPVLGAMELYVAAVIKEDSCEILHWRIQAAGKWEADDRLNVWQGFFDEAFVSSP